MKQSSDTPGEIDWYSTEVDEVHFKFLGFLKTSEVYENRGAAVLCMSF